jgi:hypothetical protein
MRYRFRLFVVAASLVALAGPTGVQAQDEFSSPDPAISPRNALRADAPGWTASDRVAGQEPGVEQRRWARGNGGWLGERANAGRPPTLEELRAHLISRGIDPVSIDQRIARIREARRRGLAAREGTRLETPSGPDPVPAELSDRGVDPTTAVEARLARMRDSRGDFGRVGRQVQGSGGWEQAQLQSRLVHQGLPPQTLNERLGKLDGAAPRSAALVGPAVGGGAGRVRSRR